jgi:hypothetical protein
MSIQNLAQFIRYHKSTREVCTIHVHVGGTDSPAVPNAYVYDDQVMNRLLVKLPSEAEPIVLDANGGPTNPRLNTILFNGYTASVFLFSLH